jgi:class 3 adenylate cyclase
MNLRTRRGPKSFTGTNAEAHVLSFTRRRCPRVSTRRIKPRRRGAYSGDTDMVEAPSGTVTLLFTDIEGSTRLLKQLRSEYGQLLADHHRLMRAALEQHAGREMDTQGEAFFAVFTRAKDAVAAAIAAQLAHASHDWPKSAEVRVRMGLHTAEPEVVGDRYFGLGVHRAARLCAVGHGGQVLLSAPPLVWSMRTRLQASRCATSESIS